MTDPCLVVGVGSELRADDAVGRRVADAVAVAAQGRTAIEVLSVHQLTPELAVDLAGRSLVVFVDAAADATEVTVREMTFGSGDGEPVTHRLDPAALLALADRLGLAPDAAAIVSIPVVDLGFGTHLDRRTRELAEEAVRRVLELCRDQ